MSLEETERLALVIADMAGNIGGRLKLDYWKLAALGMKDRDIYKLKHRLGDRVDYGWPLL